MDYKDEQNNEIEALDSIYSGEMESKLCKCFSLECFKWDISGMLHVP
jgi:hypothetical protein